MTRWEVLKPLFSLTISVGLNPQGKVPVPSGLKAVP